MPIRPTVTTQATTPFACPWRHPDCVTGPGRHHYRHVPVHEALTMPDTPEEYLANVWIGDPRSYLALAARRPVSDTVRARVVDLACCGPNGLLTDAAPVAGEEWLRAALPVPGLTGGDLNRLAGVVFGYCRTSPQDVAAELLTHPLADVSTVDALLGTVSFVREPALRDAARRALDAAGWPATLTLLLTRRHRRPRPETSSQLLRWLVARPDTWPVLERILPTFTGTLEELLGTAAAVTSEPGEQPTA